MINTLDGERRLLRNIRERYFADDHPGRLRHLPMCRIVRDNPEGLIFCSCGLLHDLAELKLLLAETIYHDVDKESYCQQHQIDPSDYCPKQHKEERIKCVRLLHDMFGPPQTSDEELREEARDVERLIQDVFGEPFLKSLDPQKAFQDYLECWNEWRVTSDGPDSP